MTIPRGMRLSAEDRGRLHRLRKMEGPYRKAGRLSRWDYTYIPPSRVHIWWGPNGGKVKVVPAGVVELTMPTGEVVTLKLNGGTVTVSMVLRIMAILHLTTPATAGLRLEAPR